MDPHTALKLLDHLNICSLILLFSFFVAASFVSNSCSEKKSKKRDQRCVGSDVRTSQQKISQTVKRLFSWLSIVMVVAYLTEAIFYVSTLSPTVITATTAKPRRWWHEQSMMIHIIGFFLFYTTALVALLKNDTSPTIAHFIFWSAAVPIELATSEPFSSILNPVNQDPTIETLQSGQFRRNIVSRRSIELTFNGVRIATLLALVALYASKCTLKTRDHTGDQLVNNVPVGTGPLHLPHAESGKSAKTTDGDLGVGFSALQGASGRLGGASSDSWWRYLTGYKIFFPYMWPSKSRRLQVILLVCLCLTISQLVVNALVPFQTGVIAMKFSTSSDITWFEISMYAGYMWLQGGDGLLCSLRSIIWDSVSQNSSMELSIAAFKHVHSLSLDFHLGKRNGEILSSLSNSKPVTLFLGLVTFQVVPAIFDFGIAVGCLWIYYDAYSALALSILVFGYLYMTAHLVQRGSWIRRRIDSAFSEENAVKNDSLMSYETVKYFTAEDYEIERYRSTVEKVQNAEYQFSLYLEFLKTSQNTLFMICILIMCFIAAYKKSIGHHSAGEFTYMVAYMSQLRNSLKFLAGISQPIQSTLISSESMLELLQTQPAVVDNPHATPLTSYEGNISFENVIFSYDKRKTALNGLTFECQAGTTTALVGESGGGKSTVFRLLFRFYNPDQGYLRVDGHDVRSVTIDYLRRHIGVVPQDTLLFNETLMYNLRYANQDATEKQIHDACRAASVHDKIMAFPDGYNTKVGERGLRLSGGEKQRVAIARTILKNPKVILLDEATASLDTDTEEHIQRSLATLSHGRTMLVIAHRLSTITEADCIIVLHEGQVVESGTHKELLDMKGRYAGMWKKQTRQET